MTRVRAAFPYSIDVLNDFILPNSAKVATGEDPPWQEWQALPSEKKRHMPEFGFLPN